MGSAGTSAVGTGGQGNEIIVITGTGGTGGTSSSGSAGNGSTGSAGNTTTGSAGNATTGSAGNGDGTTGSGGNAIDRLGRSKVACGSAASDPLAYTSGYTPDSAKRTMAVNTAMAMSDAEKAQQMTGLPQSGSPNYNVFKQEDNTSRSPTIRGFYFRDGPRGVNLNANSDGKSDYSTAFPVAIARGAAFDDELEYQVGLAIGDEMVASGNTMMLAPTVNILRHPAWGRAQETYGEDVFLLGRLGSAFVQGVQQYAAACAKHYAANNIENGRETAVATMAASRRCARSTPATSG